MKKLDIKSIFIIILGIALIVTYFMGGNTVTNNYEDQIENLHKENQQLVSKNDSLKNENIKLDDKFAKLEGKIKENDLKLAQTQSQLEKLNKRRNEIPTYVNSLSVDGIADAFTEYLEN
jgi:peptidoglycan hydrolase CwlO-like protein